MKIQSIPPATQRGPYIYQQGRYGPISRALVIPIDPRTPAQCVARSRLAYLASHWSQLTQPQRNAWDMAARQHQTKARRGQSQPLNGQQLFVKINCARRIIGATEVSLPPAAPAFYALPVTGLMITNTGGAITLKLTVTGSPADGTTLRGAPACSQGRDRSSRVVYLATLTSPIGGAIDITTLYTARFGAPPVGSKVFVRVNQNLGGWEDAPHQFSAIVPAAS